MATAIPEQQLGPSCASGAKRRRLSQLELALEAEIAARHLSFVETGRGAEVFLGVEAHRLPSSVAIPTEDGVELTPVEGHEQMAALLHRPSEYPAEAAPVRFRPSPSTECRCRASEGRIAAEDPSLLPN